MKQVIYLQLHLNSLLPQYLDFLLLLDSEGPVKCERSIKNLSKCSLKLCAITSSEFFLPDTDLLLKKLLIGLAPELAPSPEDSRFDSIELPEFKDLLPPEPLSEKQPKI